MMAAQPGDLELVARELLTTALSDDLLALYSSTTPEGEGRFWLWVRPDTSPQRVHTAVYPLWKRHHSSMGGGLLLTTSGDGPRYARVLPEEVINFWSSATHWHGEDLLADLVASVQPEPLHSLAWIADEALIGSAILTSPDDDWRQTTGSTLPLSQRLLRAASRTGLTARSPGQALAGLHTYLAQESGSYPAFEWEGDPPSDPAPPHLPGLLALVGWGERLIVVLPRLNEASLAATDWGRVAELVAGEFETLLIATPWQLRLVATVAEAVAFAFHSFERVWGADVLSDCQPADGDIRMSAAILPVRTLVERLPADYVTTDESELGRLIHAVQNVLQNIQMRNELWARLRGVVPRRPALPLPGRETPAHQRVEALFHHLHWWTDRWAGPFTG